MTKKLELILDIGGVLATNFSESFFQELAMKSGIPFGELISFNKSVRKKLWTGQIAEKEFWTQFGQQFPSIDIQKAQLNLKSNIKPLPSIKRIPLWSQHANIHILSNHRVEWVEPILGGIKNYLTSITISSQVGVIVNPKRIFMHWFIIL